MLFHFSDSCQVGMLTVAVTQNKKPSAVLTWNCILEPICSQGHESQLNLLPSASDFGNPVKNAVA